MNLVAMQIAENRRTIKMTVLRREGGTWNRSEVSKLVNGLTTEASQHPQHPEHLVLFGHYTKDATLKALDGGQAYTATQIVGNDNKDLPFVPGFV
jgi:cytochrome c-type biogenesis protein CcmH/NrfG